MSSPSTTKAMRAPMETGERVVTQKKTFRLCARKRPFANGNELTFWFAPAQPWRPFHPGPAASEYSFWPSRQRAFSDDLRNRAVRFSPWRERSFFCQAWD